MLTPRWIASVLVLAVLMLSACATPEPGVTNRAGTIVARLEATPSEVTDAATAVLEDMRLIIVSSASTTLDGQVVAHTAQNTYVNVKVDRVAEDLSDVSIRVGTLGNEDLSMGILNRIREELE